MAGIPSNRGNSKNGAQKPARKLPRRMTKDRLRNIALYHLERFSTSAENLRRVLLRRTLKAAQHHETDLREAKAWIDEIVDGLVRANAIDDSRYADGKTLTMLRRGQSSRKVRAYLASKGVNASTINAALSAATESLGDADLEAAQAYALRRRFGPFRTQEASAETKQKELAALGRAGFRYDIARKIVEAETEDDLL
jgi:regulatory protein